MTKVLEDNIKIIVKDDRVICKAEIGEGDFSIRPLLHNGNPDSKINIALAQAFRDKCITFKGEAIRKEGDADNVREAIHIAQSKMERQYLKFVSRYFRNLSKGFENNAKEFKKLEEKYARSVEAVTEHIKDICNSLESSNNN